MEKCGAGVEGATTGQKLKGWNRAKPESRARCEQDFRTKPKSRAKPEKEQGEGYGERAGLGPLQKFLGNLNFKSFNLVYSWNENLEMIDCQRKHKEHISDEHELCPQLGV